LRILYSRHTDAIAGVGLGHNWTEFKASLKLIRQNGYSMTMGDYNPGIVSIAAPVFNQDGEVLGSLALAASSTVVQPAQFKNYAPQVMAAAKEISGRISANSDITALPARALG